MKLNEILEEADLLVPNAFTVEQKIRWINQTQRQLYRDFPIWNTVTVFPLTAGVGVYPLPADCKQERIDALYVGEVLYTYEKPSNYPDYQTFFVLDGKINLYPIPTMDKEAKLYYQPTMTDLTSTDLSVIPSFPEDYHELLSLGCANRMAQRTQDYKTSQELEVRYNNLSREAQLHIVKPKQKSIRIVRGWR